MSRGKFGKWIHDNLVLLTGIPLLIGIHWGWSSMQDVPYLVDPSKKGELPILVALRTIKNKITSKFSNSTEMESSTQQKSE